MSHQLRNLQANIADSLEDIRALFKGEPKITLIIRNPDVEDGDVILSDDDFEKAIAAIRHLQAKAAHTFPPTGKFAELANPAARPAPGWISVKDQPAPEKGNFLAWDQYQNWLGVAWKDVHGQFVYTGGHHLPHFTHWKIVAPPEPTQEPKK